MPTPTDPRYDDASAVSPMNQQYARSGRERDDDAARRFFNSSLASVIVGALVGVVAVVGIAVFSGHATPDPEATLHPEDAVVGGVEYGSRT